MFKINSCKRGVSLLAAAAMIFSFICTAIVINPPITALGVTSVGSSSIGTSSASNLPENWSSTSTNTKMDASSYTADTAAKTVTIDAVGDGKFSSTETSAYYAYTEVGTADFDLEATVTVNTQLSAPSDDNWAALIATTGLDASTILDSTDLTSKNLPRNKGLMAAMFGPNNAKYQYRTFTTKGDGTDPGTSGGFAPVSANMPYATAKLRLARTGNVYSTYYYDGTKWELITTESNTTRDATAFTGDQAPKYIGLAVTRTSNVTFSDIKLNGESVFTSSTTPPTTTVGFATMDAPTISTDASTTEADGKVTIGWSSLLAIQSDVTATAVVVSKPAGSALVDKVAAPTGDKKSGIATFTLDASGTYIFKASLTNGTVTKESLTSTINYTLPLAKPSLTATAGEGLVALKWNAVAEATSYDVYQDGVLVTNVTDTMYTAASLTSGKEYSFYVVAKRGSDTNQSDTKTATPVAAGAWLISRFGNGSGATVASDISVNNDEVTITSEHGKITAGTDDGISFYYKKLSADDDFEITSDVEVLTYNATSDNPQQRSFGLMIRDAVGTDKTSEEQASVMAALGATAKGSKDTYGIMGIIRTVAGQVGERRLNNMVATTPTAESKYKLSILKVGDTITFSVANKVIDTVQVTFTGDIFVGAYAARKDADIKFTNLNINDKLVLPKTIAITSQPTKTTYYQGETLNTSGMAITAEMTNNTTENVNLIQCKFTGFDSTTVGEKTVTVNYNGVSTTFKVNILELILTSINVTAQPFVTDYYLGEAFNGNGLTINKTYNSGLTATLNTNDYTLSGFDSSTAGTKVVTASYTYGGVTKTAAFNINVANAKPTSISVQTIPTRTVYYQGYTEDFDNKGLSVLLTYSNGDSIVLASSDYTTDATVDTTKAGYSYVNIYYKDLKTTFKATVITEIAKEIKINKLPVTTILTGEAFDPTGIEVVKLMNSPREIPAEINKDYIIDTTYVKTTPGVYTAYIKPVTGGILQGLRSVNIKITVRDKKEYSWNSVVFGASTSKANNIVEPSNPGTAEGTIRVAALDGAGKITGSHDGISYYYTELNPTQDNFKLTAKIKVNLFAKPTPDGQEGFGIMARDAIGVAWDNDNELASNIAFVGGFKGDRPDGVNYAGALQLMVRYGINDKSGAGAKMSDSKKIIAQRPKSGDIYTMTLEKTNSGFTGKIEGIGEDTVYLTDLMNKIDTEKMYLGFFTARWADIEVSDVNLVVTDVNSDMPKQVPEADPVIPYMQFSSIPYTTTNKYNLSVYTTCPGYMTITQDGTGEIIENQYVSAGGVTVPVKIPSESSSKFKAKFVPSTEVVLSSYNTLYANYEVTMRTFSVPNGAIYTAPNAPATGKGTIDSPVDILSAINFIKAGQTVIARGGTYNMTQSIDIVPGNNGTASALKTLAAYPNEKPVFDFGNLNNYLYVDGNYWHIYGIDVTHSLNNGIRVGGNYNVVEMTRVIANAGSGLQISRRSSTQTSISQWPSYNTILNCEAFDNCDASQNNADGFTAKLTTGVGNKFIGCIARNNIDDGWDLYTKLESGAIGAVTLENCIAYENGKLTTGPENQKGDKNGYKLGGEGIAVNHVLKNCIAFGNYETGFTNNSNPSLTVLNCIAYNNKRNVSFTTTDKSNFKIHNFVSYPGERTLSSDSIQSENKIASNYFYDGTASKNSEGKELKASDFVSLTPSVPYNRSENGDIIFGSFLKVVDGLLPALPDEFNRGASNGSTDDSGSATVGGGSIGGGASAPVSIAQAIENIASAPKGSVTVVNMTPQAPAVSTSLFSDIKGKDAEVELNFGSFIWRFNGKDIKDIPSDRIFYNMGVQQITQKDISSVAGSSEVMQIELAHNGLFPCEMDLIFNVGSSLSGKTVYLNYFNEKTAKLEPTSYGVVDTFGNVTLGVPHASKYVVTTENVAGAVVQNTTTDKKTSKSTTGKANVKTGLPLKPLDAQTIVENPIPYVKAITPSADTKTAVSELVQSSQRGNVNMLAVIIVTAIVLSAAGGYLFLRKRKHQ